MKLQTFLMFLMAYVTLPGCSTTSVDESWKQAGYKIPSQARAMVIAVAPRESVRKAFESRLTASLEEKNITTIPSFSLISDVTHISKEKVRPILVQNNINVLIISSVKSIESSQTYQPVQAAGPQDNLYRNFDTYQVYSSTGQHETGSYSQHIEYILETNLFDMGTDKLTWSITTRSSEPRTLQTSIENLVEVLIKRGEEDELF